MNNIKNKSKIIDLTWPLSESSTVYPGDSVVKIYEESSISENGFATTRVSFNNHTGTHIDYPSHFFADGLTSSNFNIQEMYDLETLILDFSSDTEKTRISADDISMKIENRRLNHFRAVIFKTKSCEINISNSTYTDDYTALDIEAAKLVIERFPNIGFVGIDYLSIDLPLCDDLSVHKMFLKSDICILTGLKLDEIEFESCQISISPLRMENANGAPIRCIARRYS